jgi:hypothetical protein
MLNMFPEKLLYWYKLKLRLAVVKLTQIFEREKNQL